MADWSQLFHALERRVRALERKGSHIGFGRSTTAPTDTGKVQSVQVQVDALTTIDKVPLVFQHGQISVPPVGSDLILLFLDGDRSKAVVIATNDQATRNTGAAIGDAGLFAHSVKILLSASGLTITDASGSTIVMDNANNVNITAKNLNFTGESVNFQASVGMVMQTPTFHVSNALAVTIGPITVNGVPVIVP